MINKFILGLRDVNAELSPPSYVEATQPIIPEGYAGLPSTSDSSQHPNDATTTLERMSKIAGYHSIGLKPGKTILFACFWMLILLLYI